MFNKFFKTNKEICILFLQISLLNCGWTCRCKTHNKIDELSAKIVQICMGIICIKHNPISHKMFRECCSV